MKQNYEGHSMKELRKIQRWLWIRMAFWIIVLLALLVSIGLRIADMVSVTATIENPVHVRIAALEKRVSVLEAMTTATLPLSNHARAVERLVPPKLIEEEKA